jgi:FdhD protein
MTDAGDRPPLSRPEKRGGRMSESAVVEEVPVWLEINGRPAVTWMCTPDLLEELAVGWLHGEGYVEQAADVHLRPCASDLGFWAEIDPARVDAVREEQRRPVLASGCGAVSTFLADAATVPAEPRRGPSPDPATLRERFKDLFARGERYRETGGIHAAALTAGPTLLAHAEDIGRHNAVDKVIGAALLAGEPVRRHGMLVTGRISAELAHKGARSGLAWIATPSVPSTLAVEIARRAGMVLIGRAVSAHPQQHGAVG